MTTPPRPGYWLANDGKWYPPELHPDRIRERLAAEREKSNAALGGHTATPPNRPAERSASEPTNLASPMPHPSEPPLDHEPSTPDVEVPVLKDPAPEATTTSAVIVPETPDVVLDETPEVLVPETPEVLSAEVLSAEVLSAEVLSSEVLSAEAPAAESADLEIADPDIGEQDGPTDAELLEIERLEAEASSLAIDLPVDDDIQAEDGTSGDSRWSRRSEPSEQADTVPLVPAPQEAVEPPQPADPTPPEPAPAEPTITEPKPATVPPAAPPVFEAPATPSASSSAAPASPAAASAAAVSAATPTIDEPAATPQRAPIPEPFPEASADDLVEEQPQKSFLQRWWLPIAFVLAALALVNWVIMPYIDTDRNNGDENQLNVFELATGTCINQTDLETLTELKGTVERVPCSSPHTHEIFHNVNHAEGTFDRAVIEEFATNECLSMFETYTGEFYSRSQLKFILLLPNEKAWDKDDRTTICALFGDAPLTESARS